MVVVVVVVQLVVQVVHRLVVQVVQMQMAERQPQTQRQAAPVVGKQVQVQEAVATAAAELSM